MLLCGLSLVAVGGGNSNCGVRVSHYSGFSRRAQALGHAGSVVEVLGLIALWHVGSSQTRDWTYVPYIGRGILNHWTTREVFILKVSCTKQQLTCCGVSDYVGFVKSIKLKKRIQPEQVLFVAHCSILIFSLLPTKCRFVFCTEPLWSVCDESHNEAKVLVPGGVSRTASKKAGRIRLFDFPLFSFCLEPRHRVVLPVTMRSHTHAQDGWA